jgi:peptidoglycan-associated lipoprotein
MRNKKWLLLFFLSLLSLSILTASCAKKTVKPYEYSTQEAVEESDLQSDQINQQAIEEEGLQAASEIEIRAAKAEFETDDIFFNKKSYSLDPEAQEILIRKAEWLMAYPEINVIIQGHTDEPGTAEYNFALGDRRAGIVKSFLIQQGIEPSRLTAVSFGKERPAETGNSEETRAKNRRVHFLIE